MEKNDRYSFRCNEEVKQEFMAYCKVGSVSPSDVLQAVMIEFNQMAKTVMSMEDVSELRRMLQSGIEQATSDVDKYIASTEREKYLP